MAPLQRLVENLLLVTGSSRALLLLARPDGEFAIGAEAVQHAQQQLRNQTLPVAVVDARTIEALSRDGDVLVDDNELQAKPDTADPAGIAARMLAPLIRNGRPVGAIVLHHSSPAQWREQDKTALRNAQTKALDILAHRESLEPPAREDLRAAAVQAVLDRARIALDAQRCTFRQPVEEAYAFPVTFESRADGLRSLLGDFTIVQTGQPVIVKLLAERKQVVQEDCRTASTDPLFHKMLAHYGGMQAQVVTPFIVGDQLKGVLSVHELRSPRVWTAAEKALAAQAAMLIGTLFETK